MGGGSNLKVQGMESYPVNKCMILHKRFSNRRFNKRAKEEESIFGFVPACLTD